MKPEKFNRALQDLIDSGLVEEREVNGELRYFLTPEGNQHAEEIMARLTRKEESEIQ